MLEKEKFDYFKIEDNFKEIENVQSFLVFGDENRPVPKITFSIPTYKRERTLIETIESILFQDLKYEYDIIIVDNNPERGDVTELALEQYKNFKNIRYYKNNQNVGMAGNWNKCFLLPKSEWVVLLHDDDMIRPDYLNNIVPCFQNDVDAIFPELIVFNDGYPLTEYSKTNTIRLCRKTIKDLFLSNNPPSGIIMRRSKVLELGGYSKQNFAPDIFLAKIVYYGNTYTAHKQLILYRKGINESTKIEAMEKMCILNHDFRIQAWSKMGMPKILIPYAIPYCDKIYERMFRLSWNDIFRFSYMSRYSKRQLQIGSMICKIALYSIRIERKLFRGRKVIETINGNNN